MGLEGDAQFHGEEKNSGEENETPKDEVHHFLIALLNGQPLPGTTMLHATRVTIGSLLLICLVVISGLYSLAFTGLLGVTDLKYDQVLMVYYPVVVITVVLYGLGWLLPVCQVTRLYHLTTKTDAELIRADGRLGGEFGIFALSYLPPIPTGKYSLSRFLRTFLTWVPKLLDDQIPIEGAAVTAFRPMSRAGLVTMARYLLGVFVAPLGYYDLNTGTFVSGVARVDGEFQQVDSLIVRRYQGHQRLLGLYPNLGFWVALFIPLIADLVAWLGFGIK